MTHLVPAALSAAWILCATTAGTARAAEQAQTVDALVSTESRKRGLTPSPRCDDAVFLRRVFLDLTGKELRS